MMGVPYKELVGNLMYVMVAIGLDLSKAMSIISQFMSNLSKEHWVATKRILRYLQERRIYGYNIEEMKSE